jgi:hypothetical protein
MAHWLRNHRPDLGASLTDGVLCQSLVNVSGSFMELSALRELQSTVRLFYNSTNPTRSVLGALLVKIINVTHSALITTAIAAIRIAGLKTNIIEGQIVVYDCQYH